MSKRSSIVLATVTFVAIAVAAAAVIGAFAVVDQRAAQTLQSDTRFVPAAKKGTPPPRSGHAASGSGTQQASGAAAASALAAPARAQAQTVGSGAAPAPPLSQQGGVGEPKPAPDTMLDSRDERRGKAHHRHRRHSRHGRRSWH